MFRLALFFVALLVSTLAAFGFYFSRRFAPLMESPEVALIATPAHLVAPAQAQPPDVPLSAPVLDNTPENRVLLEKFSRLLGETIPSLHELHKRALAAAPFSTWGIPFRGVQRSKADIALLSLKYQLLAGSTAVELYETPCTAALILHQPKRTVVMLTDRQRGVSQNLVIGRNVPHPDDLIAAVVTSYAFAPSP
ncbi:MAG: hypothetical protein JSS11_10390 [Verrucomicrobia bacterium]|nr:hypothetical protein [Verrucomicrobiota bacterium]